MVNFMALQLDMNLKFLTPGKHLEVHLSCRLSFSLVVPKLLSMRTPQLLVIILLTLQSVDSIYIPDLRVLYTSSMAYPHRLWLSG